MFKEFKTLLPYLKQHRVKYLAGLSFLVLTDAGQLFIPQITKGIIDRIASGAFAIGEILGPIGWMLTAAVFISVGRFGWRYFIHGASRRIETSLRDRLFSHLLTLSSSFYGKNRTGDLMARATNDMQAIRMATGMALVAFVDGVFMSLAILVILFAERPRLALFTILPLPVVTFMMIGFGKLIGSRFKSVQEGFSRISEHIQEALSGIRVIKAFVQEPYSLRTFEEVNAGYKRRNMALVRIWGLFFPIVTFLAGLTTLILLRVGGEGVLLGTISPGEFVATLSYLEMLIWPMLGAGFTVNILQRGAASLARVNEVLSQEPEIRSLPGAVRRTPRGALEVRNLTFTYPDSPAPALEAVSFSLDRGKTLGILGRTGSGKTTLLKMFPRMLEPPRGTVFIDGIDVLEYDLGALRSAFGVVPQDTFLFSASIRENIAFGAPDADERLLHDTAEISTITRDLTGFPEGWSTEVGERGVTLSGGQKQRIAISRALTVEPAVLVFDDALSSVDTETEEKILSRMLAFRKGRTNIIISHRVSTLKIADLIIVLDKGRLVQAGTHDELVSRDGFYAEIFSLQQLTRRKTV